MSADANYQGERRGPLCSSLEIERSNLACWGKYPNYGDLCKNTVLGVPR